MSVELSRRIGRIWHAMILVGLIDFEKQSELSKDMDNWENFEDLPEKLQSVVLEYERRYKPAT